MNSPYSYGYISAFVSSPRWSKPINIGNLIVEFNIYESIINPTIQAELVITDSANISQATYFIGQERVAITVYDKTGQANLPPEPGNESIAEVAFKKSFIVTGIERGVKGNDSSSVYTIKLIDEESYLNMLSRFSRMYRGKPEDIVRNVLLDQLGAVVLCDEQSEQEAIQIINPYTSNPLMTALWVTHRCTINKGAPFFLYPLFHQPKTYRLRSLDAMLQRVPLNKGHPFRYSSIHHEGGQLEEDFNKKVFTITNMGINEQEDMFNMFSKSATSAQYMFLDLTGGFGIEERFKASDILNNRPAPNSNQTLLNYDDQFNVGGGRTVDEGYNSYSSMIVSSSMFMEAESYNSIKTVYDNETKDVPVSEATFSGKNNEREHRHFNKMNSRALRAHLSKQIIKFQFPGYYFLKLKQSVIGEQIEVIIPKDRPSEDGLVEDDVTDYKKSGTYIIHHVRHRFGIEQYSVTCGCVKLHNMNSLSEQTGVINVDG